MPSTVGFSKQLTRAAALLEAGKLSQAEGICRAVLASEPGQPLAAHLLGLIRVRGGDAPDGERHLRRSLELAPGDSQLRVSFANFLRHAGRLSEAEGEYRVALRLRPDNRPALHGLALTLDGLGRGLEAEREVRRLLAASGGDSAEWSLLGFVLANQNRLSEAEAAYGEALARNPRDGLAQHNLGSLLARMDRAEEALTALERAEGLGTRGFELAFSRGRALSLLYRTEEAEQAFAEAVSLRPGHIEAQLNLARLRFMHGDPRFARGIAAAAAGAPGDVGLQEALAAALLRAGHWQPAEEQLRQALVGLPDEPRLRFLLSQVLRETERLPEAEREAAEAASALPGDAAVTENLVSILLSRGRPEDAVPFIDAQRRRRPDSQAWLAYEATAARLLGRSRYAELFDYRRFVRAYELTPPAGFATVADLNRALGEALGERHRMVKHPLDQSLRHGSQTTRNLLADPEPVIRATMQAFAEPLREYVRDLGREAEHPFTARNQGAAAIAAGWSVQLRAGGFHVNHYHDQGWISSAYYVAVPEEADDIVARNGWLNFGAPRFATPGAAAAHWVQPRSGLLVLFPSYMWHGTNPIHGARLRTTIAFDAVPARSSPSG